MAELKPCPFCGGKAEFITKTNNSSSTYVGISFAIECSKCHARHPEANEIVKFGISNNGEIVTIDDGRGKAIEAWNRRAEGALKESYQIFKYVEVVRCIDCKHHEIFNDLPYCNHTRGLAGSVSQDGYCYLGEMKNNGSE